MCESEEQACVQVWRHERNQAIIWGEGEMSATWWEVMRDVEDRAGKNRLENLFSPYGQRSRRREGK